MVETVSSNADVFGNHDDWDWEEARRTCLRVARRYAASAADAEDMAQNALLRAWRHRDSLREANRRSEWLAGIARREALRTLGREVPVPMEEIELSGTDDRRLDQVVERIAVRAVLDNLSEGDRSLVSLRYEADMTQSAIAEQFGIPEGTVKTRLHRVREKIRRGMETI